MVTRNVRKVCFNAVFVLRDSEIGDFCDVQTHTMKTMFDKDAINT